MQFLLAAMLVSLVACKGGTQASKQAASSHALLPSRADLAVRVDVERASKWAPFGKVAPLLLGDLQPILAAIKSECGLDAIGEAKTVLLATNGGHPSTGDTVVIVNGLAKDKVLGCTAPDRTLRRDGDLISIHREGKAIASAKFFEGDLVVLAKGGGALVQSEWATREAAAKQAPAWEALLDPNAPASVRIDTPARIIVAKSPLELPFVVTGTLTAPDATGATRDGKILDAMAQYLQNAKAGKLTASAASTLATARLEASPDELDTLIALVGPLLAGNPLPPPPRDPIPGTDPPIDPKASIDCQKVLLAVDKYLDASLARTTADRAAMEKVLTALRPEMKSAFDHRCTTDQWSRESMWCHISAAEQGKLARFEACPLSPTQRRNLDADLAAALGKVGVAPIKKDP